MLSNVTTPQHIPTYTSHENHMSNTLILPETRLERAKNAAKSTARLGLLAEHNIRHRLFSLGIPTVDSSPYQNQYEDIDCVNPLNGKTISIKCMNAAVHTGNLCFELTRFDMASAMLAHGYHDYPRCVYGWGANVEAQQQYKQLDKESASLWWIDSWYNYSKADCYVIGVGDRLYYLDVELLHKYTDEYGFDDYRAHLSSKLKIEHRYRRYTDYSIGLMSIDNMQKRKLIKLIS